MGEVTQNVRASSKSGTVWGIIVLIMGMFCIAVPWLPGLSVVFMVGIALIATGAAQFMYAFKSSSFGEGALRFIFGFLAVLAGGALLFNPAAGLATITMFLAAWFVVDGIFALIAAFGVKPAPGWGWMAFSGVISVVLGVMIYRQFPESAVWLVGVLVGIRLVFAGWTMIALGAVGKSVANNVDQATGQN